MSYTTLQKNWRYIALGLIIFFCGFLIGFTYFKVVSGLEVVSQNIKHEIILKNPQNIDLKLKLDSLSNLRLENAIALVEKKNDGRFEVLTWSAVLVLTLLAAFITVNFIISSAKVREIVDIEIDKKNEEIRNKNEDSMAIIESRMEEIDKLGDEAEKAYMEAIEYSKQIVKSKK
jgi:cytoskeletal protein RodZ